MEWRDFRGGGGWSGYSKRRILRIESMRWRSGTIKIINKEEGGINFNGLCY